MQIKIPDGNFDPISTTSHLHARQRRRLRVAVALECGAARDRAGQQADPMERVELAMACARTKRGEVHRFVFEAPSIH